MGKVMRNIFVSVTIVPALLFPLICVSVDVLAESEILYMAPPENPPHISREPVGIIQKESAVERTEVSAEWTYHKTADGEHPNDNEQQYLWFINRARSNPTQEGIWLATMPDSSVQNAISYFGVDTDLLKSEFAQLDAKPPAAFDNRLYQAANLHSLDLIARDAQDHTNQFDRVLAAGFQYGSARGNVFSYAKSNVYGHAGFNIDWGYGDGGMQTGRGHRMAIMSIDGSYTNVGIAAVAENDPDTGVGPFVVTQNFCSALTSYVDHYNRFIVGTVWQDENGNDQYDPGEGLSGVTVTPEEGSFYAVTGAAGGYAVPATEIGSYRVSFSGGELGSTVSKSVTVAGESILLDLIKSDTIPGDIVEDGVVDLADIISALQITAGIDPAVPIQKNSDVDGDGLIGLVEAVYGLRVQAGIITQ